jgi:hypothetical protein
MSNEQQGALISELVEALSEARRELAFIVHGAGRKGGFYQKTLSKVEHALARHKKGCKNEKRIK